MEATSEWLARLHDDLQEEGTSTLVDATAGTIGFETFEGSGEHLPAVMQIDEAGFRELLDGFGEHETQAGTSRRLAGYRLFLVALDAVLRFQVVPGSVILMEGEHLVARPRRQVPHAQPVPGAHWSSERPSD